MAILCVHLLSAAALALFLLSKRVSSSTTPLTEDPHSKRSANYKPFEKLFLVNVDSQTLEIINNTVRGTTLNDPPYGLLRFRPVMDSVDKNSQRNSNKTLRVTIYGIKAEMFVCMNWRGKVYASKKATDECHFYEDFKHKFNFYYHAKYRGKKPNKDGSKGKRRWYLGIKNNRVLRGYKTKQNSEYVRFLPRSSSEVAIDQDKLKPGNEITTPTPTISPFRNNARRHKRRRRKGSPFSSKRRERKQCKKDFLIFFSSSECNKRKRATGRGSMSERRTNLRHRRKPV